MTTLSGRARRKLLFSSRLSELAEGPLVYLDVGARGELDEPWSLMPPHSLAVIGFEPDAGECTSLNASVQPGCNRIYYPAALWSHDAALNFHINVQASASSVYPANMGAISRFDAQHWKPREPARVVSADATTLDAVVARHRFSPDFLKLDTQGAELPILKGAIDTLANHLVAVTAETWTTEVYKGQALSGEILTFMQQHDFSVFDFNVAAAWRSAAAGRHRLEEKLQLVGLDFLFFRASLKGAPRGKIIKAAAIADVFGFPGMAVELLDCHLADHPGDAAAREAKEHIIATARVRWPRLERFVRVARRLAGFRTSPFARIH